MSIRLPESRLALRHKTQKSTLAEGASVLVKIKLRTASTKTQLNATTRCRHRPARRRPLGRHH